MRSGVIFLNTVINYMQWLWTNCYMAQLQLLIFVVLLKLRKTPYIMSEYI